MGFFEKIRGNVSGSTWHTDRENIVDDIRNHLETLLNTRLGSVPHLADYGLPHIGEVVDSYPKSIEFLRDSVKRTIDKYEPRLKNVQVKPLDQESEFNILRAVFQITAELDPEYGDLRLTFLTSLTDQLHAKVSF